MKNARHFQPFPNLCIGYFQFSVSMGRMAGLVVVPAVLPFNIRNGGLKAGDSYTCELN